MNTPVHIRVVFPVISRNFVDYAGRMLRGRRIVQVDGRKPVDLLIQDREVASVLAGQNIDRHIGSSTRPRRVATEATPLTKFRRGNGPVRKITNQPSGDLCTVECASAGYLCISFPLLQCAEQ